MNKIELNKLNKVYKYPKGEQVILSNINLRFESGKCYAIVGPSGCGKTTLLNIIAGFDNDYEGDVYIGDFLLKNFSKDELANYKSTDLVYIQQNAPTFEKMNINDNINIFKGGKRKVDLSSFKIKGKTSKKVYKMSGGEKQRINIIRDAINNAKYILLDEPTASLDHDNAILIMDFLKRKYRQEIIILVTHDLALANQYADEVLEMKDGKIKKNYKGKYGESSYVPSRKKCKIGPKKAFSIAKSLLRTNKKATFTYIASFISGLICLGFSLSISSGFPLFFSQQVKKSTYNNEISLNNNRKMLDLTEDDFELIASDLTFVDCNFTYFLDDDFYTTIYSLDNQDEEFVLDFNLSSLVSQPLLVGQELGDDEVILTYTGEGEDFLMDNFGEEDIVSFFESNVLKIHFYGDELDKEITVVDLIETTSVPNFSLLHSSLYWNKTILEDYYPHIFTINNTSFSQEERDELKEYGYYPFLIDSSYILKKEDKSIIKMDVLKDYAETIIPIYFDEEDFWLNYYNGVYYFSNTTFYNSNNKAYDKMVYFTFDIDELSLGSFPEIDSNEVVISRPIATSLFPNQSALGKEITIEYGNIRKQLYVSGIWDYNLPCIYQNPIWYNNFFSKTFDKDTSNYQIHSYILFTEDDIQATVKHLKTAFPTYEIYSLTNTIYDSLDEVLTKVNIGFYIIVGINLVIAFASILILSYIETLDYDKQFRMFINNGFSTKDISKIMFFLTLLRTIITIVIASFSCLIICSSVNSIFKNILEMDSPILSTSYLIPVFISLPAIIISCLSSFILRFHLNKEFGYQKKKQSRALLSFYSCE